MPEKRRVLFLCTGNSCRSQMAEGILRQIGSDLFEALSAGSHPAGFIHPLAAEAMQRMNIPIESQISKSWEEFADTDVELVITLCDAVAGEPCPTWPGNPLLAHWPLPDPTYYPGSHEERVELTLRVAQRLNLKIQGLLDLDFLGDPAEVRKRLEFLGEM